MGGFLEGKVNHSVKIRLLVQTHLEFFFPWTLFSFHLIHCFPPANVPTFVFEQKTTKRNSKDTGSFYNILILVEFFYNTYIFAALIRSMER